MLDEDQIINIVAQELSDAAGSNNDSIGANREAALAAYLGDSSSVPVGRSSVVSTDVADAIEWIMPEIMKAFTQNNDVVTFDPVFEGDERQAELESKFVYDILMKDNNGFIIIHQFVKDALMQKNGFVKIFYSNDEEVSTSSYTSLTEPEYNMIIARDGYELIEETIEMVDNIPVFDIKCKVTKSKKKLNVLSIAPEEFRINQMHNSVSLSDARFTAHVMYRTRSDLVKMGYDKEFVDDLPSDPINNIARNYRFTMQGEDTSSEGGVSDDTSQDLIELSECYMHLDINEDGIAELVKVTCAGWDNPTELLDIEEIDEIPFVSATAILMSHKLFGLSIYDRLIEIQNQKTSLWRNILDNMYLQNNQRTIVIEGQVNLDDLMISRPGGIIRAKRADAVIPYATPQLSSDSYQMMDYLDKVRAGRSGVSPDGAIQESSIGDRVGSEGIEKMMNAKEELVGLMVRVIAETGIKPICYMIRSQVIRHQDVITDYQFRGKWVKVDPSKWADRSNTTVRVGTGSGNRKQQMSTLQILGAQQAAIKATPGQVLVTPVHEFNLLNDIAKLGGFASASPYFLDPESPEGKQNSEQVGQQMKEQQGKQEQKDMALVKAQVDLAQAEMMSSQIKGQLASQKQLTEGQKVQLTAQKQIADAEIAILKQQLAEAEALVKAEGGNEEMRFKYWDRTKYYETELIRIAEMAKAAEENNEQKEAPND